MTSRAAAAASRAQKLTRTSDDLDRLVRGLGGTPAVLLVIGTSQRHHQRVRGSQNVYGAGKPVS
ncbi:MAG: hypothetical protein ACREOE_16260, partial [Gemmatimonadales bacterium]